MKNKYWNAITNGIFGENPLFRLVLGTCPSLAVTTAVDNAFWMGLMVIFVLTFSNIFIAMMRKVIPDKIRIPSFVIIIATLVTVVDLFMKAYMPAMHATLGIFIPLIVVNCIILARAESFAYKNGVFVSACDGFGMGLGYMVALIIVSAIRELLGNGSFFGIDLLGVNFPAAKVMVQAPGAFLTLGMILGIIKLMSSRKKAE